jgi:pimeloyl-ACP methyl ester carboxylesterase
MQKKTGLPTAAKLGLVAAALGAAALFNRRQARKAEAEYPPEGKFVELDGIRLHYVERGDGPPLVMFHGMGALVQDLLGSGIVDEAAKRFRVIAFDRPGYGYSDRPRSGRWTPEAQMELARAAIAKLGIEKPLVLGHSWGTLPALAWALDHPDEVTALVLVSGPYFPFKNPSPLLMSMPSWPMVGAVMANTTSPLVVRAAGPGVLKQVFAPNPVPQHFIDYFPHGLALRPKQIRATSGDAGLVQLAQIRLSKRYGELKLPVAIVQGDGDKVVPFIHGERLHAALPQSSFHVAHGVGHMVHWIEPELVIGAIDAASQAA